MKRAFLIPALITISFIAGLFSGERLGISVMMILAFTGILFMALLGLYSFRFKIARSRFYFLLLTSALFWGLGILRIQIQEPDFSATHYMQRDDFRQGVYKLQIHEILKSSAYYDNYVALVLAKNKSPVSGKILLRISVDSMTTDLQPGEEVLIDERLQPIPQPLNPDQFDYSRFMKNRGIYRQLIVSDERACFTVGYQATLRARAYRIRSRLEEKLLKADFAPDEKALIEALILGQRSDLSPAVYQSFIDAGVVHILAISGLHVGILLGLLLLVLKPITVLRYGHLFRMFIVIVLLWGYAFVTGLSPSVLRAVTMFSLLSFGLRFNRRVFSFNMLCLSALVLLMVQPRYVFEVGFQLSYSAVLSILIFQDKGYKLFAVKNRILRYMWRITSVTLAAQIGVLPLSLYYFHQLPGLFFVSNLLLIPFMGILLGVGVGVLIVVAVGLYPQWLFRVFSILLQLLLKTVKGVAGQTHFKFEHVYFSEGMLLLSFLSLILLAFLLYFPKKVSWNGFLMSIIGLQLLYIAEYRSRNSITHFYIFHKTAASVLGWHKGHKLQISSSGLKGEEPGFLNGFLDKNDFTEVQYSQDSLFDFYSFGERTVWIIRDDKVLKLPVGVKADIILLINSPPLNLERLLREYQPKQLVADGSNYKTAVERWGKTAHQYEIPFYYTGRKGFFLLDPAED